MFCSKCGKEISDQARFCNYCGAQVGAGAAAPSQMPSSAPKAPPAPKTPPAQQPPAAQKKSSGGKWLLRIVLMLVVYFGVRYATEHFIYGKPEPSNFEKGFTQGVTVDASVSTAMSSCIYGAIYQDGYVTYGMTKLHLPGYSLLAGEGSQNDWLISADETTLFCANKQLEIVEVAFSATTRDGVLKPYKQADSNASIVEFETYYVNNFPVIRYIARYSAEGVDQYAGELIVFPGETTKETIRLSMSSLAQSGYGEINRAFDSLNIYTSFAPSSKDHQITGYNRIVVK